MARPQSESRAPSSSHDVRSIQGCKKTVICSLTDSRRFYNWLVIMLRAALDRSNRTDEIAKWIRSEIESGSLPPGSRLEERELAEKFQVSKTPVREALIQLASRGFIELRQRKGATVSVLSAEQVIAMFEVMTELEGMAVKLCATRMSLELRKSLMDVHSRSEGFLDDPIKYDELNIELHELFYRGACNEYLESNIKDLRARLRIYRRFPFQRAGRIRRSFEDHQAIITAIMRGDGEAAKNAMHDHLTTGGRIFADLVAELRFVAS